MKFILVLCGMSGSGKDTIQNLIKPIFKKMVSHTTRPKRVGEIDGEDYYFITKEEFQVMKDNGDILEERKYDTLLNNNPETWHYGLSKKELESDTDDYLVILDFKGIKQLLKNLDDDIKVFVCYLDATEETRKQRAIDRGSFSETEWNRREKADMKSFDGCKEFANKIIDNNDKKPQEVALKVLSKYARWRKIFND